MAVALFPVFLAAVFLQDETVAKFGTTVVVSGGLEGSIYKIKHNSKQLPEFDKLKPIGKIYTSSLNVPTQSFLAGFPGVTKRFEWFAIEYSGRFWVENPGEYKFMLSSDDGSKLFIDGRLIIDNDGLHAVIDRPGEAVLSKGIHTIRVPYFQGPREFLALMLQVARPGQPLRIFNTEEWKPPPDADLAH